MDDDYTTPGAGAALYDRVGEVNRPRRRADAALLKALGGVLGVLQQNPRSFMQAGSTLDEARIQERIAARTAAKQERNFAEADRIRDELAAHGVLLKDSAQGTSWVRG
jgi:cysteinyl-tRNA synthetase